MFSQAFRQKQQQQGTTIQSQFQYQQQQQRAFSTQQFPQLNDSLLNIKKTQNEECLRTNSKLFQTPMMEQTNETQTQQINDMMRILDQLQCFMQSKFNDINSTLQEHEKILKPLADNTTQITQVLLKSEKLLTQVQNTLEKTETTIKTQSRQNKNSNKENQDLSTISGLLEKLDNKLLNLADEVEQITQYNQRFQIQIVDMVNQDKLENRDQLQRVLSEMRNTKKSVSKKIKQK